MPSPGTECAPAPPPLPRSEKTPPTRRGLIVEQKSAGRDLGAAYAQAGDYCDALPERERPRYILVSNFRTFHLYDLHERDTVAMKGCPWSPATPPWARPFGDGAGQFARLQARKDSRRRGELEWFQARLGRLTIETQPD